LTAGAQLAICARKQGNVEARAKELRDAGVRVFAIAGSLPDEVQVRRLIDDTLNQYGRLDILMNLAGGSSAIRLRSSTVSMIGVRRSTTTY
jgi:NAD(P)-dependent dehydrogenase (short-subunit alcohol dehydrogenase family)